MREKLVDINHDNVQYLCYVQRQINYVCMKLKVNFDESLFQENVSLAKKFIIKH